MTDSLPAEKAAASGSASFDGVHRDAVDKTAALMFARGVKHNNTSRHPDHWSTPPPMRMLPNGIKNLAGATFGRFVVIALHKERIGSWVVRCACGDYETRRARAILNPANQDDMCHHCRRTRFEKTRSDSRRELFTKQNPELSDAQRSEQ